MAATLTSEREAPVSQKLPRYYEQTVHDRRDTVLARRFLHLRNLADAPEYRNGVADMLRLDDQPQPVRQRADVRRLTGIGQMQGGQRGGGPVRQRDRMVWRRGELFWRRRSRNRRRAARISRGVRMAVTA